MQQLRFQVAALSVIIIINGIKIAPHPSFPTSHWEGSKGEQGLGSYTGHSLSALLPLFHPPAPTELFVGTPAVASRSPWLGGWGRNAVYAESSHCCKIHLKAKLPQCFFSPINWWILEKNCRLLPCQAHLGWLEVHSSFPHGVGVMPWRWMLPVSVLLCYWDCTEPAEILVNGLAYVQPKCGLFITSHSAVKPVVERSIPLSARLRMELSKLVFLQMRAEMRFLTQTLPHLWRVWLSSLKVKLKSTF